MDREQSAKILAIIKAAYPGFYKDITKTDAVAAVELWATMFADDTFEDVAAAVKTFIACDEKGFPPHIGAIKSKMRMIKAPEELSESEAWSLVRRSLSHVRPTENFAKLPPAVKKAVGGPSQLRDWALMDLESLGVVQSNFMRAYRTILDRQRETQLIPEDVRAMIQSAQSKNILLQEGGTQ